MKWTPWIIVIYMLAALCWWTFLLYSKNEVIYKQQLALIEIQEATNGISLESVQNEYDRQKRMIVGEGLVFMFALISGIVFLYAAYRRTLAYSERQNNFLLSVTHELKSPLASIKLAFETIKKRTLKPEQNKMISENGIEEVDRLHNQVENILTATSIDQQYIVQRQLTSLEEILNEIKIRRSNRPDENRVNYNYVKSENNQFLVDIHGCLHICDNLIGNALKYSDDKVDLLLKIERNKLIIRVADLGHGISEKEKKNIFKRFYRIGNEETRRYKGTGLGLYIVNRIVEKNDGSVKVINNKPKGSIFNVEIGIK